MFPYTILGGMGCIIKSLWIFFKSLLFPFFTLKHCSKEKNVIFNEILDNDKTIGMEYIIECSDFVYLMYLAIDKNKQGNGYGSKSLDDLISI